MTDHRTTFLGFAVFLQGFGIGLIFGDSFGVLHRHADALTLALGAGLILAGIGLRYELRRSSGASGA